MLTVQEIKTFIESDRASKKKKNAEVGLDYYEGRHSILNYRIFFVNNDGEIVEDKWKSNIKIPHPFFAELVDQEVQYMLSGKDGFVKSDDEKLQALLDEYFNDNEDFMSELYEIITGCIAKGFEYAYAYKDEEYRTRFKCADSLGVVEVKAKETDDHCDYVIYWYVDNIGKDNKKIKRIQVWDEVQTYYYCQENDGEITLDESEKFNPRPHTIYSYGSGGLFYEDYGVIPFFRLDNCKKQLSGLVPIKALIDDYDLHACGMSNNLQDTAEALYVVKGYQGDNLDEVMLNIRAKKTIGVGEEGGVDVMTVNLPYEARKAKLELDEKNIYRFGMGFNSAQMGDGNITNIVIKSRYALLDLKCNKLEIRLKQFMRKLLKVVLAEINLEHGTDYQQKDVYFDFEREVMTNAADNAQIELVEAQTQQTHITTLLNLASKLDDETLMSKICDVMDIDYEEIKDKLPKPEEVNDPYQAVETLESTPTEPVEGDVIE